MAQANITDELIKIRGEDKGEIVRDSIISAFNKLNDTPMSANSVNGYTVNDLLLKSDSNVAAIFPLETELKEYGTRAVTSGGIYNYLEKVDDVIDGITGNTSSIPYDSTSIKNKLSTLNNTKKQIRAAIIAKQVEVDKDASFRSYADKVKAIPTVAEIQTSEVTISKNDEYDAGKGKAYSVVTAEVKPNTAKKNISKIGKYKAEDDGYEAYSEVEVDITSGLKTKSITASDLNPDSYETTISITDEKDKDAVGYSEVSIDVSGKFAELKEEIDPNGGKDEFVFDAGDEDLYGYSKVTITMLEIVGPFTVEFYDGENKLWTDDDVPKNGTCNYKGSVPMEKEGYIFKGWDPKPVNVTKNMKCYAQWEKKKGETDFNSKSWNSVGANGGADAIVDQTTKTIYWDTFQFDGTSYLGGSATARCVAKGEDGTTSTWVMYVDLGAKAVGNNIGLRYITGDLPGRDGIFQDSGAKLLSYEQSHVASFFEIAFAAAIRSVEGQEELRFQNVNKYTMVCDSNGCAIERLINCGSLWLLSAQEMGSNYHEKKGKHYSGFNGTLNGMTRSLESMQFERSGVPLFSGTIENEFIVSYVNPVGNSVRGTCPAHIWWNTDVESQIENPLSTSIWYLIKHRDTTFDAGYFGPVNIGFCL